MADVGLFKMGWLLSLRLRLLEDVIKFLLGKVLNLGLSESFPSGTLNKLLPE